MMFGWIPSLDTDDDVPNDGMSKWGRGVAVPLIVTFYGASVMISQRATLTGLRRFHMQLTGTDAVAYGISILAVALFLHARYYWSNSDRLVAFSGVVKTVALLFGIASLGVVIARNASPF